MDAKTDARKVHEYLLEHMETKVFYKGDCRGCGECCARFLPITVQEEFVIGAYMKMHGIEPRPPRAVFDMTCPFLDENNECAVYEVRPQICRNFRCDLHKEKRLPPPKGWRMMREVDMRERFGGKE